MRREVLKLIAAFGVEAIAFGSHAPFDYVGPSPVRLENLAPLGPVEQKKIAWRKAVAFFGLAP